MNFKTMSALFFCMIFFSQNSIVAMNYDQVSSGIVLGLQTRLYRFKELLGLVDRRVEEATDLETKILRTQVSVRIEELTAADLRRYNEITQSFQSLRKDLHPYQEVLKNRNRWCGCFCFLRRQSDR